MSHDRTFVQVLAGVVVALVVVQPAWGGAYAFSTNDMALSIGNVTLANPANVATSRADDSAEYRGNGRIAFSDPRNPDPAESGPGPFPGRDSYGAQGAVGQYARADAILDAVAFNNLRGRNVAEAFRTSPGGAYGNADMDVSFALAWAGGAPVTISLFAAPALRVSTGADRESAHADLNFRFTFFDNGVQMFQWTPNGTLLDFVANPGLRDHQSDRPVQPPAGARLRRGLCASHQRRRHVPHRVQAGLHRQLRRAHPVGRARDGRGARTRDPAAARRRDAGGARGIRTTAPCGCRDRLRGTLSTPRVARCPGTSPSSRRRPSRS